MGVLQTSVMGHQAKSKRHYLISKTIPFLFVIIQFEIRNSLLLYNRLQNTLYHSCGFAYI